MPRFPELDTLVSAPLPYCRVILALGNGPELHGEIAGILPSGSVMAVKVTAATTKGHQLPEREWNVVKAACDMMFKLEESKRTVRSARLWVRLAESELTLVLLATDFGVCRIADYLARAQYFGHCGNPNRDQDSRYRRWPERPDPDSALQHLRKLL